jgi:hypothetical protein
LSFTDCAVAEANIYDFSKLGELDVIKDDKRAIDLHHGTVIDTRGNIVVPRNSLEVLVELLSLIHLL